MKERSPFYKTAAGNFLIILIPVATAFALAFALGLAKYADAHSPLFYIGIGLIVIGWCLLVRSKWDQIRRGELCTFGVSKTHPSMRGLYWLAYITMIVGWLIATFSGQL